MRSCLKRGVGGREGRQVLRIRRVWRGQEFRLCRSETSEAVWRISVIFQPRLLRGVKCSGHVVSVVVSDAWEGKLKVKGETFSDF